MAHDFDSVRGSAGDMVEDAVLVLLGLAMLPAAVLLAAAEAVRERIFG